MDYVIILLLTLNLVVTAAFFFKFSSLRSSFRELKVMYFTDVSDVTEFMKRKKKIQVKAQLLIGEIPIGHPFVVSEQITETVDEEKVRLVIDNIAKPLAALGIKVITNSII